MGECVIHECKAKVFASSKPISMEIFRSALAATGLNAADNIINNPIPLCKHHYFMLYHYSSPTQTNCVSCNVSIKRINARSCPNPFEIEHLRDKTGCDGNSKDTDKVCMSCYKFHLSILHQQKVTSTDKNIVTLINSNEDKELDRV